MVKRKNMRPPRSGSNSQKVAGFFKSDMLKTIGAVAAILSFLLLGTYVFSWMGYTIALHVEWLNPMRTNIENLNYLALKPSDSCPSAGVCSVGAEVGGYCHPDGLHYPAGTPCSSNCYYNGTLSCDGAGNCVGGQCKGDCTQDSQCPLIAGAMGTTWSVSEPFCSSFSAGNCIYQIYNPDLLMLAQAVNVGAACDESFEKTCLAAIPEEHRDCFEVEQNCILGAALLPGDMDSLEIADIHYSCYAKYKCSDSTPLATIMI